MDALENLWYGNIFPMEKLDYRTEEYQKQAHQAAQQEKLLLSMLSPIQAAELEKLLNSEAQMQGIVQCAAFVDGFRLASQILVSALYK